MNQVKIPVKISTPQLSKPFVLKHFRLEARVGIGLQTPRFREKMAHLEPLLKHNPPLSGITQTYTVGVRFGVRNPWSESSGLCSVFRGNFRTKPLTFKAALPLLDSTRFYSFTTRLLKNSLETALGGSTGHVPLFPRFRKIRRSPTPQPIGSLHVRICDETAVL